MKKMILVLMLFTTLSKVLGFLREIILAYVYGASNISDAYLISQTIPITILSFVATGIATSYIPMYSNIKKDKSIELADQFTNNIINFIFIICTVIMIIVLLFTTPLVKLFASGFDDKTLKMAVLFTKVSVVGIYFSGLTYVFSSYMSIKKIFIAPALMGIPFNFFIIVSIFMSNKVNIIILPIGSVIAAVFQVLMLIPFLKKCGYKYSFVFNRKDEYLKKMIHLSIPVIIGVSVNQINVLVDRTIASLVTVGGISALSYGDRLIQFVNDILIQSLVTVIYPTMANMAAESNITALKKSVSKAISGINLLVVPITIGIMIFAEPLVRLVFGRGAFDSQAISKTSTAMFFYSIGIVGFGLREILARVFYSMQDTRTPMINAVIALVTNIILSITLSKFLGIGGLALANSISAICCMLLLFISFRKKVGPFGIKEIIVSLGKILCASLVMGMIVKFIYKLLLNSISGNLSLIVSIGTGALVYFAIIYFMKIDEVDDIVSTFKIARLRKTSCKAPEVFQKGHERIEKIIK
ncbi:murein biosynthesis integral membrane protein MurJ [Clostridium sp. P21]|uniref:Probable lipid II flippase MurJ n=1 Tax=Clostridium muellerianum TaxID=2716538 RepID=A0A7Y0EHQ9_9CLOT|nr:murein biosynthesis integral membrane protein MurJ [Clostridium muellerianum]NMM63686.1 murein biosynthesis integral membrane protein MurJ [Clostridium muellerianum]